MPDKRIAAMITIVGEFIVLIVAVIWFFLAKIEPSRMGLGTINPSDTGAIIAVITPAVVASIVVSLTNLALLKVEAMRHAVDEMMLPLLGPFTILDSILVALISGVSEEFLFRGVLQTQLLDLGRWLGQSQNCYPLAVFLSALAFAMAHFKNKRYLPYTFWAFLVGLLMSYLLYQTGSIYTPMLAHALINFVSINVLRKMYANRQS